MTRTHPSFPIAFRVVAIFFALAAVLGVACVPGAATPKDDLEAAKKERQEIQDRVEAARAEYDVISADLAVKSAEVEEAEARLEDVTANLLTTQAQLDDATAKLEHVQSRLDDRAAEAFMAGPGTSVEFLLGSTTLSDLSDRIEFVGALAQSDEELAQRCATPRTSSRPPRPPWRSSSRRLAARRPQRPRRATPSSRSSNDSRSCSRRSRPTSTGPSSSSARSRSLQGLAQGPAGDGLRRRPQLRADARGLGGHPGAVPGRRASDVR